MNAHSNYTTVESDFYTAMLIAAIIFAVAIIYYIIKFIRGYNTMKQQLANHEYKKELTKNRLIRQRAVQNFFENRIEEDIEDILENNKRKQSSKANKLISLYTAD